MRQALFIYSFQLIEENIQNCGIQYITMIEVLFIRWRFNIQKRSHISNQKNEYSQRVQPRTSDTSNMKIIKGTQPCQNCFVFKTLSSIFQEPMNYASLQNFRFLSLTMKQQRVRKKITKTYSKIIKSSVFNLIIQIILKAGVR